MSRIVQVGMGVVVVVGAVIWWPRAVIDGPRWESVTVQQGLIEDRLVCRGEFAPQAGRLIAVPFNGRLQFVAADGTWVDEGAELFAIAEDDAVREAADLRSQLLAQRQELRLSQLRRRATEEQQARVVEKAERAQTLEQIRWRIETIAPQGGAALIRLDAQLKPLEVVSRAKRDVYEAANLAWQAAQNTYLEAVDARSIQRDSLLRIEAQLDERQAAASRSTEGLQAKELAERAAAVAEVPKLTAERDALAQQSPALAQAVVTARAQRDGLAPARDQSAVELAQAEAAEADIRILLEIEKKHITATQLALDLASEQLQHEQTADELRRAEVALAAGAISQAALDDRREAAEQSAGQVAILSARLAIAQRPTSDERLAELRARLERAEVRANSARADRDRALAVAEQELAINQAKVQRLQYDVSRNAGIFPEVLQSTITFLDQEIRSLDSENPDDAQRLIAAQAERVELAQQLEQAKLRPSNVVYAPYGGVIRVQWQDGRPKQAGDQVWEEDVLIEIFPPENMAVKLRVNEVDVRRVQPGLAAEITAPALPGYVAQGRVLRMSALGRDKLEGTGRVSGVVQFEGEVSVDHIVSDLRQGMTAVVTVIVDHRAGAVSIPLGAVTSTADGYQVHYMVDGQVRSKSVSGQPFGDSVFMIDEGLQAGEQIVMEQR